LCPTSHSTESRTDLDYPDAVAGFILLLHARLALAAILFAILLGAWGSYQYVRHKAVSGGFRSAYLMLCGLTAVQGLVGILNLLLGAKLHNPLHVVYGIFAVLFLPGLYFYSVSGRSSKAREAAFLAAACWIVLVALGRGWITGQ
jgi:heme A synthase